jgi:hypothetical protein
VTQLLHGLFPNSEGKSDAVVQIQGDTWRACVSPDASGSSQP